ncbi:hypothetical protein [Sphingopyxis panaciterrae]
MTPGWWATALVALAAPAAGDKPAAPPAVALEPSLAAWYGEWTGTGTAFGKPAAATLTIGPAAKGDIALAYHLSIEGAPRVTYSAEAMYRVYAAGRVSGNWTDSYGRTRPVGGHVRERLWVSNWGSADVEIGRSTYRLEGPNSLVVNDSVLRDDGSWRSFSVLRYRRDKA